MSCKENLNELIQYDPNALRVSGNYLATTFTQPLPNDASWDVLANGGMISAVLSIDFTVRGRLIVPKPPSSQHEGIDEIFEGIYTIKNDSLQFKNFQNVLSLPQLYFKIKDGKLEGKLETQTPIIVVLEKQD